MVEALAALILKYRKPLLVVTLLVGLMCATSVPFLTFNFTPQQLFASSSDRASVREEVARTFGREDNLLAVLVVADEGRDVFDTSALSYTHQLTLGLRALEVPGFIAPRAAAGEDAPAARPTIKRAASITTMEVPRTSEDGALTTRPLAMTLLEARGADPHDPTVIFSPEEAARVRAFAMSEPLVQGRLVDERGSVSAVLLWLDDGLQEASDLERVNEAVQAVIDRAAVPPGYSVRVGGIPRVRVDVMHSLKREQLTFVPLTGFIYFLILIALFRRVAGALLPLGTVLLSVLATTAMLVLTDSPINIINNILPTMIFIIGISDSIHMLTRQAEEAERGLAPMDATRAMLRHTGLACLLTSATTAVGFVSLVSADTTILQRFGLQAAFGVLCAFVFTVLFIPTALSYLKPMRRISATAVPRRGALTPEALASAPWLERGLMVLARAVLRRPALFLIGGLLVTAGFGVLGSRVRIDTTLLEIYQESHPTYQTSVLMEERLGGILPVEISVKHPDKDHFKTPEAYAKLATLQQRAGAIDGVLATQSFVDFHQAARQALLGDVAERAVMPDSAEQIAQLHLLIEGPPDSRDGARAFITDDFSHARLLLRVSDFGAQRMIVVGDTLRAQLSELFPPAQGYTTVLAGDAYVASVSLDSFIRDLFASLLMASVIIFVMMTLVFRSLKLGLISVVPNLTPLIATFGYMGWAGITLNTTTIIIFAISLGLAVDDTIHFLARFKEELDRQPTTHDALMHTFYGAGRAILLTSVLLLTGLLVLLWSDFKPSVYFARLTAITIGGALLGDLLLLPPLLLYAYRDRERATEQRSADL